MSEGQKVIKYIAIAFGVFLSVNIISWIAFGIITLLGVVGFTTNFNTTMVTTQEIISFENELQNIESIKNLDVKIGVSNFIIKIGEKTDVKATNVPGDFTAKLNGDTLEIKTDEIKIWNSGANHSEIILYVPESFKFENVKIKTGVSSTYIEKLDANNMELEFGVGKVEIDNITSNNTKIKTGAGKVDINNAIVSNTKLETGIGSFYFKGQLMNNSYINSGIGKLDLNLTDNKENYAINTQMGIGRINIENTKCENNQTYGNGNNKINVNGGIGSIDINFIKNN